jgi:hypothetical protein
VESLLDTSLATLIAVVTVPIAAWVAGALFYDVGRAGPAAGVLILIWAVGIVTLFVIWQPAWKPFLLLVVVFALFLVWWFGQRPSHARDWQPNFAILPQVSIEGGIVTMQNVRETDYRSLEDYTPIYATRVYDQSHLAGLDVLICYWGSSWMCHPIFVFDFGCDGRVCISIEVRYRVGQTYNLLRSLYRQQELCYIVCDERDAILRRTKYAEGEDVFLYRVMADEIEIQKFFLEYVERINDLLDRPRWYHGLTANCTTTIYMQRRHEMAWDWRLLLNGRLDQMLYEHGRLDQSRPLADLRQESLLNEIANRAPREGFGDFIRRELPGYR